MNCGHSSTLSFVQLQMAEFTASAMFARGTFHPSLKDVMEGVVLLSCESIATRFVS
jgi:hypothetical protein